MKTLMCNVRGIATPVQNVDRSNPGCHIKRNNLPCPLCPKLKNLEQEILETNTKLEHLLHRCRELKIEANHLHDPIIHRLPVEIASAIFTLCTPLDIDALFGTQRRGWKVPIPITIGAVCQKWRRIAWSTPQIWTSVLIRPDRRNIYSYAGLVSTWISRSGALPLIIKIEDKRKTLFSPRISQGIERLFNIVNDVSTRWMSLDLNLSQDLLHSVCGKFGSSDACILSKLILTRNNPSCVSAFSLKNIKPRPSILHSSGFNFAQIGIDWSNLREVSFEDVGFATCLETLYHAPCLTSFTASRVIDFHVQTLPPPPRHILHQSLEYYCEKGVGLSKVYERLTLPSLRTLRCDASHIISCESLYALIDRSLCALKTLSMSGKASMMSANSLMQLLNALPSLNELDLIDFPVFDLLNHLKLSQRSQNSTEIFLPHLRVLRIQDGHDRVPMDSVALQQFRELQAGGLYIEVIDRDGKELLHFDQKM